MENKFKYKFTVWNSLILISIPISVYTFLSPSTSGGAVMAAVYFIPIAIIGAVIDFVMQVLVRRRLLLAVIQVLSLAVIIFVNNH